jgi:hypothetical protein
MVTLAMLALFATSSAFVPNSSTAKSATQLSMAPRFDKSSGRWFTDSPEEQAGSSYGPIGSLYRAGPKPFLQRIFNADTYDQVRNGLNKICAVYIRKSQQLQDFGLLCCVNAHNKTILLVFKPLQAVLKYMAQAGCDRKEAQGEYFFNM